MKPYVITVPEYRNRSAGVRFLHYFCSLLNDMGLTAYITGNGSPKEFNVKYLQGAPKSYIEELKQEGIVVYPDIVQGNPLKFRNVVRWDLAPQRFPYIPNDQVFVFSKVISSHPPDTPELYVFHIEDFFKPPDVENRIHSYFWVGKGTKATRIPETSQCREITYEHPRSRLELATMFQSAKIFYNYDENSNLTTEARLCGCPTIIIEHGMIPIERHRLYPTFGTAGYFLYGDSPDPAHLRDNIESVKELYELHKRTTQVQHIQNFIEITQKMDHSYVEDLRTVDHTYLSWMPVEVFK